MDAFDIAGVHSDFFEAKQKSDHVFGREPVELILNGGHHFIEFYRLLSLMSVNPPQLEHLDQQVHQVLRSHLHSSMLVQIVQVTCLSLDLYLMIYLQLQSAQIIAALVYRLAHLSPPNNILPLNLTFCWF